MTDEQNERIMSVEQDLRRILANQSGIEGKIDALGSQMRDVLMELGGVPDATYRGERPPIRERLHLVETKLATDAAARHALDLAREERKQAEQIRSKTWSRRRVATAWGLGVCVAVSSLADFWLRLVGAT